MCGIFGQISNKNTNQKNLAVLALHARQRGKDSSGLIYIKNKNYIISRADFDIKTLFKKTDLSNTRIAMGHSRLVTNGMSDNQPVYRDGFILIHNGIILNESEVWNQISIKRQFEIDSEAIIGVAIEHLRENNNNTE